MEGKVGNAADAKVAHEAKLVQQQEAFKKARKRNAAEQQQGQGQQGKGKGRKGKVPTRPPKPSKAPTAEELDARMLGALITGVRRAFPYVPSAEVEPLIEKHSSSLFRWVVPGVALQLLQGDWTGLDWSAGTAPRCCTHMSGTPVAVACTMY
jgi:hypothetical protein